MPAPVTGPAMPTPSKWVCTATGRPRSSHALQIGSCTGLPYGIRAAPGRKDAGDLLALAEPPDLGRRGLGMLRRDDERPAQPRLALEPLGQQPVVIAATQARGEQRVGRDREGRGLVRREDPDGHLERVEDAVAHRSSVWPTSWAPSAAASRSKVSPRNHPAGWYQG